MRAVLLLVCLLSALSACSGQCPISACDGLRSFSSSAVARDLNFAPAPLRHVFRQAATGDRSPRLLWSYERHKPSGAGCVTNGAGDNAVVLCPMADGQNVSMVSFAAGNGSILWYISLSSQAVLPLLSYDGQSVLSDGRTLDWLARDGRSLSPPVPMYPTQGPLFDLTITSTSIVTMLYKCGFIATYTVDGVPISGLWLNATVQGVSGTFIPLTNPVMNNTRLYVLTAFRQATSSTKYGAGTNTTLLRLYAINVAASLDRKFTILWTYDVSIDGLIPYIYSKETYCNTVGSNSGKFPRKFGSPKGRRSQRKLSSDLRFPLSLLTMTADRLLVAVHLESADIDGGEWSFNLSVRDVGETYSIISSGYSTNFVTSISWSNTDKGYRGTPTPTKAQVQGVREEGSKFWLSISPPYEEVSVLEQWAELAVPPPRGSSLTLPSLLTTPVTLLHTGLSAGDGSNAPSTGELLVFGSAGGVSCDSSVEEHERRSEGGLFVGKRLEKMTRDVRGRSGGGRTCVPDSQPQLVGVATEGGGGRGGAPDVAWSVSLPRSQPVQGQISSLSFSPNPLIFVTTPLGVYAYTL